MICPIADLQRGAAYLAHRCRGDHQLQRATGEDFESMEDLARCVMQVAFHLAGVVAEADDTEPDEVLAGIALHAALHVSAAHPGGVQ